MDYICVAICNSVPEAHMLKGKLENEGVSCFLTNENISTLLPFSNSMLGTGIQVNVNTGDEEKALQILEREY
ncbi:MAG: DUF2007 domain-containing protein [Bacteroidales bacterium]|nr:DUF2007 domain-containing protein [Bacteroidales bacterium]